MVTVREPKVLIVPVKLTLNVVDSPSVTAPEPMLTILFNALFPVTSRMVTVPLPET